MSKSKNEIKNTSALEFIIPTAVSFVVAIIISLIMYLIYNKPYIPKYILRVVPMTSFIAAFPASLFSFGIVLIVEDFIKKDK